MRFFLTEYINTDELNKTEIKYTYGDDPITIGRSDKATFTIGKDFAEWSKGISNIQCTIASVNSHVILQDGTAGKKSANGIWIHGEPIQDSITLIPGIDLTLYKQGRAKVCLSVRDTLEIDLNQQTYTGQDLITILQDQIALLQQQNAQINEAVASLAEQLKTREKIDEHQTRVIGTIQRRVGKVISLVLVSAALIILATGISKEITADERKEYRTFFFDLAKTLLIAGGTGAAGYAVWKDKDKNPDTTGES